MSKIYLLLSSLYLLIFALSDALGDAQLRSIEAWWLGKAKQSRDFILTHGRTTGRFILATSGSAILSIAIYSPFLLSSFLLFYIPYVSDKFSHWFHAVLYVLLCLIVWPLTLFLMMFNIERPFSYLGGKVNEIKLLLNKIEYCIEKQTERKDSPLRGLPIETQLSIRLISSWDNFLRRGTAILLMVIGMLGAIPLALILQFVFHVDRKLLGVTYGTYLLISNQLKENITPNRVYFFKSSNCRKVFDLKRSLKAEKRGDVANLSNLK